MPTLLVIDDDPDIARIIKNIFEKLEFNIISAFTANDALRYIEQRHPDIILLDKGLPDIDGFQLLQRLKSKESVKKIPIIMLTAETSQKSVLNARRLKVFDYIIKPIKRDIIIKKVHNAWKLIRLERAMNLIKEDGRIILERLPGIALFKFEGQITLATIERFKKLMDKQFWKSSVNDEYVLDLVPQPLLDSFQIEIINRITKVLSSTNKTIRFLVGQNYPQLLELGLDPETQLFILLDDIRSFISSS